MEIVEIARQADLYACAADIEHLLERVNSNVVFLTFPWISAWLEHFWPGKPILFLLVRDGNEAVGFAPFLVDEETGSLCLPVDKYAEHCDVLCAGKKEEVLDAMIGYLKSNFPTFDLVLGRVPALSGVRGLLPSVLAKRRLLDICTGSWPSPFLDLTAQGEHYLESRSQHVRSETRRKCRKLAKTGQVEFSKYTTPEQCNVAMEEVLHIERNSWKERTRASFTAVPGLKEFYADVAARCARRGMMCIYTLRLASEPIAHVYGIRWGRVYHALKTSYHEAHKGLSPGVALFDYCIQDALESGLAEFNFLGDESRWKNELASGIREYGHIRVCRRTALSIARRGIEHYLKPFIRSRAPRVVAAKRRLLDVLRRGR